MTNPRHLLLHLATLAIALAAIFAPQKASAKSPQNPETRVRDFSAALSNLTQAKPDLTPDKHYEKLGQLRQLASGPPLVPKGGARKPGAGGFDPGDGVLLQPTANSCGPTCGAMLLRDKGIGAFRSQIAGKSGLPSSAESLARGMNGVSGGKGWVGAGVDSASFAGLNGTGSWIAMVKAGRGHHWIVVDGVKAGRVMIRDPAIGRTSMALDDFMGSWNGFSVWKQ